MIESWVIDQLNPLKGESLIILGDPQRMIRSRGTGRRWVGQGERLHRPLLQRQPRPAGDVREPA